MMKLVRDVRIVHGHMIFIKLCVRYPLPQFPYSALKVPSRPDVCSIEVANRRAICAIINNCLSGDLKCD